MGGLQNTCKFKLILFGHSTYFSQLFFIIYIVLPCSDASYASYLHGDGCLQVLSVLKIEKGNQVPKDYSKSFTEAVAVFQHAQMYAQSQRIHLFQLFAVSIYFA